MIKLNIPLHIQEQRAKEANMELEKWQLMIVDKVNTMRDAALLAEQRGKFLLENNLISQEDVDRMLRKMQSVFPTQEDKDDV